MPFRESTPALCARIDDFALKHCAWVDNRLEISYRSKGGTYSFGSGRGVCQAGSLTFGISIEHQGWPYPVDGPLGRATRRTSVPPSFQVPGGHVPSTFPDPQIHSMRKPATPFPFFRWLCGCGETHRDNSAGTTATAKAAASPSNRAVLRPSFQRTASETPSKAHSLARCPWLQAANATSGNCRCKKTLRRHRRGGEPNKRRSRNTVLDRLVRQHALEIAAR